MAANLATAAALLMIMLAAPILEASAHPGELAPGTRAPPAGVRVQCTKVHLVQKAGETCDSVARGEGLSDVGLLNLNPDITCPVVSVGQRVCVAGTAVA